MTAHRGAGLAALAATAGLLLAGCGAGQDVPVPHHTDSAEAVEPVPASEAVSPVPPAAPDRLSIPAVDIDVAVEPMSADRCPVLNPPSNDSAYWVGCRALPGTDSDGTVFVIGHAVTGGSAVFNDLAEVSPGDTATLRTSNGRLTYRIVDTELYGKYGQAQLEPKLRERIPGRLVLVTCYLGSDGRQLTDQNFVAYADLESAAGD
ncbi:class F sortase [Gordonia sp. NPDC127522]|uniref:class F sortase n=1 Tax=Gordonia sp. NPDC127522 TaxID=3345390 RepID=UPI003640F0BA